MSRSPYAHPSRTASSPGVASMRPDPQQIPTGRETRAARSLRGPRSPRARRVAVLTAGAAVSLGALSTVPLAWAAEGGQPVGTAVGTAVSAADVATDTPTATATAGPAVRLGVLTVVAGGGVPFSVTGFPAGATVSVKLDDATLL